MVRKALMDTHLRYVLSAAAPEWMCLDGEDLVSWPEVRSVSDFTTGDRLHLPCTHRSAFMITHVLSHKPSIH